MSTIGANPLKETYMSLKALGPLVIETTELAGQPGIYRVDLGCETKLSALSNTTNKDETVDQFCLRLRGMLRALMQEPERKQTNEEKLLESKPATWDEQKLAMKNKAKV